LANKIIKWLANIFIFKAFTKTQKHAFKFNLKGVFFVNFSLKSPAISPLTALCSKNAQAT